MVFGVCAFRYFVILHPLRDRMATIVCLLLIAAIWVVSISISLPLAVYQAVTEHMLPSGDVIRVCHENWPTNTSRQFFGITSFVLQYVIPGTIIIYCYTTVSWSSVTIICFV